LTGFLLAHTLRYLRIIDLDQANFIVVGMAGILAGVLHAPLTGIFLIAEITGGYALIVPLMIVTSISFFISKHFNKHSVYTAALAHQGIDFRSKKESFSVQNISLYNLVEKNYYNLYPNMKFRDLVDKITHSSRNLFPVVDKEDKLLGVITLDDVREVMLDIEIYDVLLVNEIMNSEFITIDINSDINTVLKIFDDNNIWNIAVTQNKKFVGFISKSNLFNCFSVHWS